MDTEKNETLTPEEEIKRLRLELRKTKRKVEHLERDRRIMALMFDQSARLRDINNAEAKRQSFYNSILLENSPDIFFLLNKELVVRMTTQSFYRLATLDWDVKDLTLRQALSSTLADSWIDKLESLALRVMEQKKPTHFIDHIDIGSAVNHIYDVFLSPAESKVDGSILGVILVFRDITALAQAKEEAEAADRAKTNFLASMSHEIRTPLNAITGMSEFILRDSQNPAIIEYGAQIKNASQSLLAIINDILDFSKIEANCLQLVNTEFHPSSVIHNVINIITAPIQDHHLQFKLEVDPNIPYTLIGDERRIQQIIVNLLSNAIKYTPEGSVSLKLWSEAAEDNKIKLFGSVADTGIGIKPEEQDKLFESFVRVDITRNRSIEGTGLGLPICQRLAKAMNGDISFHSVYGQGTTFTFYIVCEALGSKKLGTISTDGIQTQTHCFSQSFRAPQLKLLLVDDNLINLMVAEGIFTPYECSITSATSGQEALELTKQQRFDIIFMDHMMPIMDGIETMRLIRQIPGYEKSPIIALTANAISGMKETYLAEGFSDYLSKPIDLKEADTILAKFTPSEYKLRAASPIPKTDSKIDADILQQVYKEGPEKIKLLTKLIEQMDVTNYTIQVHSLKSVASLLGYNDLAEIAKAHEVAGKEGNFAYILDNFSVLKDKYTVMLNDVNPNLAQAKPDTSEAVILKDITPEALHQLFTRLQKALDDYDLDTFAALIQEAKQVRLAPRQSGYIGSMQVAIDSFDYDRLAELMQALRQ